MEAVYMTFDGNMRKKKLISAARFLDIIEANMLNSNNVVHVMRKIWNA